MSELLIVGKWPRTSKIFYEFFELHLSIRFDTFVMEISVEHNGCKCKEEDCVGPIEGLNYIWVAMAVLTSKCLEFNHISRL